MILFVWFIIVLCAILIPFSIYMARKDRREFFERNGRYPNADDYLDHGMWP